jgi:hypothetical protein
MSAMITARWHLQGRMMRIPQVPAIVPQPQPDESYTARELLADEIVDKFEDKIMMVFATQSPRRFGNPTRLYERSTLENILNRSDENGRVFNPNGGVGQGSRVDAGIVRDAIISGFLNTPERQHLLRTGPLTH